MWASLTFPRASLAKADKLSRKSFVKIPITFSQFTFLRSSKPRTAASRSPSIKSRRAKKPVADELYYLGCAYFRKGNLPQAIRLSYSRSWPRPLLHLKIADHQDTWTAERTIIENHVIER